MIKFNYANGYIINNDAISGLQSLADKSIQTCVTSPPYYGLRHYCEHIVKLKQGLPASIIKELSGVSSKEIKPVNIKEKLYDIRKIPSNLHQYFELIEIGREKTPDEFISELVKVFKEVYRVMKDDGILWLNIGDSYAGSGQGVGSPVSTKQSTNQGSISKKSILLNINGVQKKELIGIPWKLAFALRDIGFIIRQDIIWHKPNPFPSSVRDRFCVAHEYLFMLTKKSHYKFNYDAALEKAVYYGSRGASKNRYEQNTESLAKQPTGKRLKRDVWTIQPAKYKGAHFATFPVDLVKPCIKTATDENDVVLDPFMGSGTVAEVATIAKRKFVGIELNKEFVDLATVRIKLAETHLDITEIEQLDMFE